jgi:hypothetical protein
LQANPEAEAEELAASFSGRDVVEEPKPGKKVKSELARHRSSQEEISKLVEKLPERVRDQMDELFKARYTRIQKLDIDKSI